MSFRVYEMRRSCKDIPAVGTSCIPFDKQYLEQYKTGIPPHTGDRRPVQEMLGHSKISTTQIYCLIIKRRYRVIFRHYKL